MLKDRSLRELAWSVAILTLATLLAFSPDAYLPMLARAFLLQWAALFFLFVLLAVWRRSWAMACIALFGGCALWAQYQVPVADHGAPSGTAIRIMHMNVLQPNELFDRVIGEVLASDADVISVQEVGPEWADALQAGLRQRYPYMQVEARTNCYGIALFSRLPFTRARTIEVAGVPMIEALVELDGVPVRLISVHASSPVSYTHFRMRNSQFKDLARTVTSSDTATILVGDLNTVPWDKAFTTFCSRTGLRPDAQFGSTWPSVGSFGLIPLDHLLVSKGLCTQEVRKLHVPGSDHLGLMAIIRSTAHAN